MTRNLDCDFFPGEADLEDPDRLARLRVFAGPRGIVIADAVVHVEAGRRVSSGEALSVAGGVDFVYHSKPDSEAPRYPYALDLRFVVKNAAYDPRSDYTIHER